MRCYHGGAGASSANDGGGGGGGCGGGCGGGEASSARAAHAFVWDGVLRRELEEAAVRGASVRDKAQRELVVEWLTQLRVEEGSSWRVNRAFSQ